MDVTMPQLGETVTEGTITRWFKQPGETIQADEPLFEVSTDKVDSEVPAPVTGVVTEIRVPEGETVEVGTVLAVIDAADSPAQSITTETPAVDGGLTPVAPVPEWPVPEPVAPAWPVPEPEVPEVPVAQDVPEVPEWLAREPAAPEWPAAEPEVPERSASEPDVPDVPDVPDAPAWSASEPEAPAAVEPLAPAAPPEPIAPAEPIAPVAPVEPAAPVEPMAPAWAPEAVAPSSAREPAAASVPAPGGPALTSPVVRRLIAQHGLDPAAIHGTGEGGRITRRDVLAAAGTPGTAPVAPAAAEPAPVDELPTQVSPVVRVEPDVEPEPDAPAAPPEEPTELPPASPVAPPPPLPPAPPAFPPPPGPMPVSMPEPPPPPPRRSPPPWGTMPAGSRGDEVVPFTNIRRRTAEHMLRSKATSAHVHTSVQVDFERISRVREARKAEWKENEGFSLTYLPFIARAVADTIGEYPHVNASVVGDSLVVHRDVHLAVAVDLEFAGLVAPVIHNADGKRLPLIAREIRDLAERAKAKQLLPDEVLGGTFTITNPGPFGTFLTLPIINQPQVAILSTDAVEKRASVVATADGEDAIAVRHLGMLALAWDHRAFDGAYAAAFLRALKERLETRDWNAEFA